MDHDTRYAYADEWVEIVRKLWTVEEEFDYAGKFFTSKRAFTSRNRCNGHTHRS
jgi:alkanesulfonate monooxygenase SsuD/methylene tetrahydromethanopterin reductase-like flavin-dependent oxidoreductase (luciferase family)